MFNSSGRRPPSLVLFSEYPPKQRRWTSSAEVKNRLVMRVVSCSADGETPPHRQGLRPPQPVRGPAAESQVSQLKFQRSFSTRKTFPGTVGRLFEATREWIVQLQRNEQLFLHLILGIPSEIGNSCSFRQVRNKPLKRVVAKVANGDAPLRLQVFGRYGPGNVFRVKERRLERRHPAGNEPERRKGLVLSRLGARTFFALRAHCRRDAGATVEAASRSASMCSHGPLKSRFVR